MQKVDDAHETDEKSRFWSMVVGSDHVEPFQVTTPPWLSTAAQKVLSGQLTERSRPPIKSARTGDDQLEPLNLTV